MRLSASWTEVAQWVLLVAMFVAAAVTWPVAPDRIPVHWDLSGQVDRYGGKFEGLLGPPLLALGIYVALRLLPRFDPGRANYAQFAGAYTILRLAILATLAAVYALVHLAIRGFEPDVAMLVPIAVGGLLLLGGNLMGKLRPNWFVGIRTPWTLSSKAAWTKSHRLGGWLLVAEGLALITLGVLRAPAWAFGGWVAVVAGSVLWLAVYSYFVWRADPYKTPPAGTLPANGAE